MTREKNRAEFPAIAAIVDIVRSRYPEAKLLYGIENGKEIGRIPADPPNWIEIDAVKFGEMANLGDKMNPKRRAPK